MSNQDRHLYEFGPFRLDLTERLLWRDGQRVTIPPIAFDTLLVLVERHGHLVTKDQLLRLVWPDSFVEEGNLTNNISILRKALGEGLGGHRYIETLPRRGYRFVAAVEELPDEVLVKERTRTRVVIEEEISSLPEPTNRAEASATEEVRRQLKNKRTLQIMAAFILAAGLAIMVLFLLLANKPPQPVVSAIRSIAVLPFKPLVADSRDEALELGMADTLIARLSNIREINIRPTSAVRKYMSLEQDALAAGRELSVESVLEGSIQRSGDRIRVTVRLMRVVDGAQLWYYQCEDKCTDIFAVQDSISERVAGALELELTGEERRSLAKRYTDSAQAYELYMKGRYFWNKRTEESVKKAIQYFQQAIDKDRSYALAYSGLADSYIVLGSWRAGGALSPRESMPKAKAAALKALEIDDSLAEAHTSLADVGLLYDWDWQTVEKEFKRAIELNPNYATAHQWYGNYLAAMGRLDEALEQSNRALEINPLSLIINTNTGAIFRFSRQYDQAIKRCKDT